jgi:4'-phosphopantetheinyl transferase
MNLHWPVTTQTPPLAPDAAHVWAVPLVNVRTPWAELERVLSAEERARAARFLREETRRLFIAGRSGLRSILAMYLGAKSAEVPIETAANGKPQLAPTVACDLRFNLAHSGELALVAVTRGREIGVDVERLRPVEHWQEIASRYFHPTETAAIGADVAQTPTNFFRCWTRKEAVLKAIGVSMEKDTAGWIDVPAHSSNAASRYWLESLVPCDGYLGAIAITQQLCSTTGFTLRV